MVLAIAGYNRASDVVSTDGNIVATYGLANCIAVVGFNLTSRRMGIAHYDTARCLDGDHINGAELVAFRGWFARRTGANRYAVGLGSIWYNAEASEDGGALRHELIMNLMATFHHEPVHVGSSAYFCIMGGMPSLSMAGLPALHTDPFPSPAGWAGSGAAIPYGAYEEAACIVM